MIKRLLPLAFAASAWTAHAADFPSLGALTQSEFLRLSEDLGAVAAYKGVTPATPLGVLGFDVGLEFTDTRLENSDLFSRAGAGNPSHLTSPKLHIYKGLFGGVDIGAFIGGAPQVSAVLYGAELRYALLDDGLATPAFAVRLAGTTTGGTGDLSVSTVSLDVMTSKKFTLVTPYIGAGAVRVFSQAHGTGLEDVNFNQGRVFGGVNVNVIGANLAFEVEKMGGNTSLSAKLGMRF